MAERYTTSSVTLPFTTRRYGLSMKPYLFTRAKGRQRVDQADIRTFRRLDRADAAVMGRMHVAHLEAGALARQTARPKRREAALMRDLRQRVGLVHELRQLRGAEELAHRGGRGLGVDQVLRHHRVDIDRAHALLDGALHAQQADAILILHQLADRAHPAVAEMVDVVDLALAVAQADQRLDHGEDVLLAQRAHRVRRVEVEPHVHLHPADGREVVALGVEEDAVEQRRPRLPASAARPGASRGRCRAAPPRDWSSCRRSACCG